MPSGSLFFIRSLLVTCYWDLGELGPQISRGCQRCKKQRGGKQGLRGRCCG